MIILVQFGINKHLLIFLKTTNCTSPLGESNFVSLLCTFKFTRAYLFQIALEIIWLPILICSYVLYNILISAILLQSVYYQAFRLSFPFLNSFFPSSFIKWKARKTPTNKGVRLLNKCNT